MSHNAPSSLTVLALGCHELKHLAALLCATKGTQNLQPSLLMKPAPYADRPKYAFSFGATLRRTKAL